MREDPEQRNAHRMDSPFRRDDNGTQGQPGMWDATPDDPPDGAGMAAVDAQGAIVSTNALWLQMFPESRPGLSVVSLLTGAMELPGRQGTAWQEGLQAVLNGNRTDYAISPFSTTHAHGFSVRLRILALHWSHDSAAAALLLLEPLLHETPVDARLRRVNALLQRRVDELSALHRVAQAVSARTDLPSVLRTICDVVQQLFDASGASVCLLNQARDRLTIFVRTGVDGEPPLDEAVLPDVFETGEPWEAETGLVFNLIEESVVYQLIMSGEPAVLSAENLSPFLSGNRHLVQALGINALMLVPLPIRNTIIGALIIVTDEPNRSFTRADTLLAETIAIQVAETIASARLFAEEHRQRKLAERRSRELNTLLQTARQVASTLDFQELAVLILAQLEQVVGCTESVLFCTSEDELVGIDYRGQGDATDLQSAGYPVEPLLDGLAHFREAGAMTARNLRADPAVAALLQELLGRDAAFFVHSDAVWMGLPLLVSDRLIGLLCVSHPQPDFFSPLRLELISAFGSQTAVALHNAQLYQQAQVTAADEERNRLARELHDAVTQTLFTASIIADALPDAWAKSPDVGQAGLAELRTLTRGALAEMRTLLLELRPATLVQKPLVEIIQPLGEAFQSRAAVPVDARLDGHYRYPADVQIALYRITQESLNNIFKHADATRVSLALLCRTNQIDLTIQDDGCGFDPDRLSPDSLGLHIMAERAQGIGATFHIESRIGHGTLVQLRWHEQG